MPDFSLSLDLIVVVLLWVAAVGYTVLAVTLLPWRDNSLRRVFSLLFAATSLVIWRITFGRHAREHGFFLYDDLWYVGWTIGSYLLVIATMPPAVRLAIRSWQEERRSRKDNRASTDDSHV